MSLWEAFRRLLGRANGPAGDTYRPGRTETIARMCDELRACPVCGEDFPGHAWALVGTAILGERQRRGMQGFFEALDERRWDALANCREWNPRGDNAEAIALRCPRGDYAVAIVHSAPQPLRAKSVERCLCVGEESARLLAAQIEAGAWNPVEYFTAEPRGMLPT